MADPTLLGILDTTVKIGLGAIISGYTTYKITKEKTKAEAKAEYQTRYLSTIEKVADEVQQFHHTFMALHQRAIQIRKAYNVEDEYRDSELADLTETQHKLTGERLYDLTSAEARLNLLGANDAARALEQYKEATIIYYEEYVINYANKTVEGTENSYFRAKQAHTEFFNNLNTLYGPILT